MRTEELLALGVFGRGSRMGERIAMLLERGREFSPRVSGARLAVSGAALLGCVIAASITPKAIAFAQERRAFDVAAVRPSSGAEGSHVQVNALGFDCAGAPLLRIIAEAYQIPYGRISSRDSRTGTMLSETYDIIAKAERPAPREQLMAMLQTLLAERFKLTLHREARVEAAYKLELAKGGPKLQEAVSDGMATAALGQDGSLVFRNMAMWRLAAFLSGRMDRPVVDMSGLPGSFDFTLRLQSLAEPGNPGDDAAKRAMNDWSQSSIFTDMPRQLGLELKADKAPVEHLVIDHAEKPSEN